MIQPPSTQQRGYIVCFDYLRIFAACFVVLLHVSAQNWDTVSVWSSSWMIFNLANSATRWAVPIFFMISGSIYLDCNKPLDITRLWRVRIPRMVLVFLFWSAFYALISLFQECNITEVIGSFLGGKYHLWYLPALTGLYIVLPLVRKITETQKMTEYYLLIAFYFVVLFPGVLELLTCLDLPFMQPILSNVASTLDNVSFSFGQINLFYFVLGHYLIHYPISALTPRRCLLMVIGGYLVTAMMNSWYSRTTGIAEITFLKLNMPNTLCIGIGLFELFRSLVPRFMPLAKNHRIVAKLSSCTFGIYLLHPFVLEQLKQLGLNTLSAHPIFTVPGITVLTIILSLILTMLLRQIPFVKEYLL